MIPVVMPCLRGGGPIGCAGRWRGVAAAQGASGDAAAAKASQRPGWWAQGLPRLLRALRGIVHGRARAAAAFRGAAMVIGFAAAPPAPLAFAAVIEAATRAATCGRRGPEQAPPIPPTAAP